MNDLLKLARSLERMHDVLAGLGSTYHITGGVASSYYGEPRFTQDVDIVIRLSDDSEETASLIAAFAGRFLIDEDAVKRAVHLQDMFQAIDVETYIRIDLMVGEGIPGEFDRIVKKEIYQGVTVPIVCKEDAILSKLIWIAKGSGKSRQDVIAMMRNPEPIDWEALRMRATDLAVLDLLDELFRDAGL